MVFRWHVVCRRRYPRRMLARINISYEVLDGFFEGKCESDERTNRSLG